MVKEGSRSSTVCAIALASSNRPSRTSAQNCARQTIDRICIDNATSRICSFAVHAQGEVTAVLARQLQRFKAGSAQISIL
jgi:hypothetical protein